MVNWMRSTKFNRKQLLAFVIMIGALGFLRQVGILTYEYFIWEAHGEER